MTQAEEIRQYVVEHYIEPARREQLAEVKIFARDVRNALGLHPGQQTSVIQALVSETFHDEHGLVLVERLGEGQGWRGVHYRLSGMDYSPGRGISPQRGHDVEFVPGTQPGHEQVNEIRRHAIQRYIEPARQEQRETVAIVAKNICNEMGLPITQTATIHEALTAESFLNQNGLELDWEVGEGRDWKGARYRLSISDYSPNQSMAGNNMDPSPDTGVEYAGSWRERVMELPMGEFHGLIGDYLKAKGFSSAEVEIVIRLKGEG